MIIQCVNCNKNFEVDSSLIPENGRNIQCGSCNHIWFYKPADITNKPDNPISNSENDEKDINPIIEKNTVPINTDSEKKQLFDIQNLDQLSKTENSSELSASGSFNLGILLSYILVSIITCIAIVIIMDTFKSPLIDIFPGLELLLYNLFETVEDMFLFIKNLLI